MNFDDIEIGAAVTVTSRDNQAAVVVGKFKSKSAGPGAPAGTEYVVLRDAVKKSVEFFNYPSQLQPR